MSLDLLKEKLQGVFKTLRGYGKLSESNVADAVREVRMALLDAPLDLLIVLGSGLNERDTMHWALQIAPQASISVNLAPVYQAATATWRAWAISSSAICRI